MIRVLHILDPELKRKVCDVLTDWRGFPGGQVPEWFELDDADYVDVLNEIKRRESGLRDDEESPDADHCDSARPTDGEVIVGRGPGTRRWAEGRRRWT